MTYLVPAFDVDLGLVVDVDEYSDIIIYAINDIVCSDSYLLLRYAHNIQLIYVVRLWGYFWEYFVKVG